MKRLKYQEQDCELTLKQGLEEYLDHIGPEAVFGIAEKNYDPDEEVVSLSENIDKNELLIN